MELWDPHFHIWDVSAHTQSGHDPQQLFAPDGNPVYTWDLYEQDMRAPVDFEHSGGAFVEAVSVCHVGTTGDAFAAACLAEATWASAQLANSRKSNVIVASAPLEAPNAGALLTKLADDPLVRGVRQIVNYRPSWPRNDQLGDLLTDRRWRDGYARLQDHAMSYDLQLNPHQFRTAAHLIETHPHIPVIVGHLGSPTLADVTGDRDLEQQGDRTSWRGERDLGTEELGFPIEHVGPADLPPHDRLVALELSEPHRRLQIGQSEVVSEVAVVEAPPAVEA